MNRLREIIALHTKTSLIAYFGSQSDEELDLFWLADGRAIEITESILEVSSFVRDLFLSDTGIELIMKHEHRARCSDKKLLHLLFYPSLEHLFQAELPSFITNVFIEGEVLSGDLEILKDASDEYQLGTIEKTDNSRKYNTQIISYDNLMITTYLYLLSNSTIINSSIAKENISYALRYFGFEIIKRISNQPAKKGDWRPEIIIENLNKMEQTKSIAELYLEVVNIGTNNFVKSNFVYLCEQYFRERDMIYSEVLGD